MFCSLQLLEKAKELVPERDMVKYLCCHCVCLWKCLLLPWQAGWLCVNSCVGGRPVASFEQGRRAGSGRAVLMLFSGCALNRFCSVECLLGRLRVLWWSVPTAQALASSHLLKIRQIFCLWAPCAYLWLSESFPADNVFSLKIDASRLLENGT